MDPELEESLFKYSNMMLAVASDEPSKEVHLHAIELLNTICRSCNTLDTMCFWYVAYSAREYHKGKLLNE